MRHLLFILFLSYFFGFAYNSYAQARTAKKKKEKKEENTFLKERLIFGGNFSATFSPTMIDVAPTLGIRVTERFVPGIGISYNYYKPRANTDDRPEGSSYGGRIWAQYHFLKWAYLQAEYEAQNLVPRSEETLRTWQYNPQVGGGVTISLVKMAYVQFTALYNLNYERDLSLYPSPWVFRVGFGFN
ncbi:MAG: hypothetical protein ACFB0B_17255 [Thermonemataceae bacterium]